MERKDNKITIDVDVASITNKDGKVYELTHEEIKERIQKSVNQSLDSFLRDCGKDDCKHDYNAYLSSITPDQLKTYTHKDMELYKPFVYTFLNKYYASQVSLGHSHHRQEFKSIPYDVLSEKHLRMVKIDKNEHNQKEYDKLESRILKLRDKIGIKSWGELPKVNDEEYEKGEEKIKTLKEKQKSFTVVDEPTVKDLVMKYILTLDLKTHNSRRGVEGSPFLVNKDNFYEFLQFILDTGMISLDDESNKEQHSISRCLLNACVKLECKEGYELLKKYGLTADKIDCNSHESFLFTHFKSITESAGWDSYFREANGEEDPKPRTKMNSEEKKRLKEASADEKKYVKDRIQYSMDRENNDLKSDIRREKDGLVILKSSLNWILLITKEFSDLRVFDHNRTYHYDKENQKDISIYTKVDEGLKAYFERLIISHHRHSSDVLKKRVYELSKFLGGDFVAKNTVGDSDELKLAKKLLRHAKKIPTGTGEHTNFFHRIRGVMTNNECNVTFSKRVRGGHYDKSYGFTLGYDDTSMLVRKSVIRFDDSDSMIIELSENSGVRTGGRWNGKDSYDSKSYHILKMSEYIQDFESLSKIFDKWIANDVLTKFDIKAIKERDTEAVKKKMAALQKEMQQLKSLL